MGCMSSQLEGVGGLLKYTEHAIDFHICTKPCAYAALCHDSWALINDQAFPDMSLPDLYHFLVGFCNCSLVIFDSVYHEHWKSAPPDKHQ